MGAALWASDPRVRGLAIETLELSLAVAALAVPLGTVLACLLTRTDLPLRQGWLAVFLLLLFMPLYLQAAAWQAGFGIQGSFVPLVGGRAWITGWTGAVWVHALTS